MVLADATTPIDTRPILRAEIRDLERRFGVVAWFGFHTRRWWALVEGSLVEAATPAGLADTVMAVRGTAGRASHHVRMWGATASGTGCAGSSSARSSSRSLATPTSPRAQVAGRAPGGHDGYGRWESVSGRMEDEQMIVQVGDLELLVWCAAKQAPGAAREFVGEWFQERGIEDAFTAQLIVSELVTNALLHGQPPIVVRVVRDESDGRPVVEVEDRGDGVPCVLPESDTAISGRGLVLVAALALEWGTDPLAKGGKVTWAKCAL